MTKGSTLANLLWTPPRPTKHLSGRALWGFPGELPSRAPQLGRALVSFPDPPRVEGLGTRLLLRAGDFHAGEIPLETRPFTSHRRSKMASGNSASGFRDELTCSICKNLFEEPKVFGSLLFVIYGQAFISLIGLEKEVKYFHSASLARV